MKETRLFALIGVVLFLCAAEVEAQRVMENLGRGLIAVRSSANEVYVGWRLLATDASAISFNLYRSRMIESLSVTHVSGPAPVCSPTIKSPTEFPIQLGTIAPGQTVTVPVELNVTKCSVNARLKLVAPVTALEGAATALILRTDEPR